MDGNYRWAEERNVPGLYGHSEGGKNISRIVNHCSDAGIKYLTLFAFSTENWHRPPAEVALLLHMMRIILLRDLKKLHQEEVKIRFLGDPIDFPQDIQTKLKETEELTQNNTGLNLQIAINYGGRWDLVVATRNIAKSVLNGDLNADSIDETTLSNYTCFAGTPEPDICIRTGGECRISNFMLWNLAYAELYFPPVLWPDFNLNELNKALESYSKRNRTYGKRY